MAKCKHISHDNLAGTTCALTGASVAGDCGSPRGQVLDDGGECIPLKALHYLRGDRSGFAVLTRPDREAVMATARVISERAKKAGGLFTLAGARHFDRDGNPDYEADSVTPEEADEMTDLSSMTSAELKALAARANAAAREREKAEKQASAARPALEAERDRSMTRVLAMNQAIEDLDAGHPVDLKALGVKIGRAAKPQASSAPKKPSAWTPERRKRQGEILRAARARKKEVAA